MPVKKPKETRPRGRPPTDGATRSAAVMLRLLPVEAEALAIVSEREQRKPGELGRLIVAADPRVAAEIKRLADG